MRLLYQTRAHPAVRVVHQRAVWWSTGKVARAFDRLTSGYDSGREVALYERDAGTELSRRRAWFDLDGNFVCNEFEHD